MPRKVIDKYAEAHKHQITNSRGSKKKSSDVQRYLETKDPVKYKEYTKLRNKVRIMPRKLQKNAEKSIAKDAKINAKEFWRHVTSRMKTSVGISDLKSETDDGKKLLVKEDVDKAQTLSDFFSSVFTGETTTEIPEVEDKIIRKPLTEMKVSENEILKKV